MLARIFFALVSIITKLLQGDKGKDREQQVGVARILKKILKIS